MQFSKNTFQKTLKKTAGFETSHDYLSSFIYFIFGVPSHKLMKTAKENKNGNVCVLVLTQF